MHLLFNTAVAMAMAAVSATKLTISLQNNLGRQLNAYVTGLDTSGVSVMLDQDGSWYYPTAAGSKTPVRIEANVAIALSNHTTELVLPDYLSSGRIWVAEGHLEFATVASADGATQFVQPSVLNPTDSSVKVNWGFVELTNIEKGGLFANISFVDWVGMIMSMSLKTGSGETQTVRGLQKGAVKAICSDLVAQASADGLPWDKLCVMDSQGNPLRILSPSSYQSMNTDAFETWYIPDYTDHINQVYTKYANQDLKFDTQNGAGNVTCRVKGDELICNGDNRSYPKPTVADIWGCNSGTFAIEDDDNDTHKAVVPRLCAAFQRTTLLLDGGDVQPSSRVGHDSYYRTSPTNHYSRIVHAHEADGRGYAFSYDDVNPEGQNAAGVVAGVDPQILTLMIDGSAA